MSGRLLYLPKSKKDVTIESKNTLIYNLSMCLPTFQFILQISFVTLQQISANDENLSLYMSVFFNVISVMHRRR